MKLQLVTLAGAVLVAAGVLASPEALASFGSTVDSGVVVLQLDWLEGLIQSIDDFLEVVLDLVRTIRALFGGGG